MDHHQQQHHQQRRSVSPEPSHPIAMDSSSSSSSNPPPAVTTTFRAQRISSPSPLASFGGGGAAAPTLLQPPSGSFVMNQKLMMNSNNNNNTVDQQQQQQQQPTSVMALAQKEAIGSIPVLPNIHLLERTAMKIPESSLTVSVLLDRILDYLRLHSVSYECESNTGCLDCLSASSPDSDMVGFVIQLWLGRAGEDKVIWLEAQRRQGCSIAMNAIRRNLFRHVLQQQDAAPMVGQRRTHDEFTSSSNDHSRRPSLDMASRNQHKRQRNMSPQSARMNCQNAVNISLRLLNSQQREQHKLGLESLTVLTNPRLVDPTDASLVSRALVLGEGPIGAALQSSLTTLLQQVHPKRSHRSYHGPASVYHEDVCAPAGSSMSAQMYHLALHVLTNALELSEGQQQQQQQNTISLASPLWQVVMECLLYSMDDAARRPHEAALSAKCIRHLLPATQRAVQHAALGLDGPAVQATVRRAHQFGKVHHKALETESQRLLGSFARATAA